MDLIIQRASGGSVTVTVDSNAGTISATQAAASAAAAASSASNAASSASSASSSATAAASSATSASDSATTATTQAGIATTQAATATTQANNAATSATNSANSATASANSATNAATSATNSAASAAASLVSANASSASATASAASATSAAASYDQFDDRYLGSKTTPPTVDNDGQPLLVGALYYNSVTNNMNVWTGTVWNAAYISAAGYAPLANPAFTGIVTENGSQIVVQTDIGTAPNEIPLNQYLGSMAYQDRLAVNIGGGVATLSTATLGSIQNDTAISNVEPSLMLNFAAVEALDPRITYTRASTATYYNGVTTAVAEQNLQTYSQEFDNAAWVKENGTVTANSIVTTAPDGTNTADLFTENTATSTHGLVASASSIANQPMVFSAFIKPNGRTVIRLDWLANDGFYVLATLTGSGTINNGTGTVTALANGWYRLALVTTPTTAASGFRIRLCESVGGGLGVTNYTGDGTSGIYVWGAQLEQRSAVSAYTPTTTQPITNYIPVLLTAASGVPRFDHNPISGDSLGFLVEQQSTNLLLRSDDFANASWSKTNTTVTSNTIVAPDGTLTGDALVVTSAGVQCTIAQGATLAAVASTFTCYVKASSASWVCLGSNQFAADFGWFNVSTGVVGSRSGAVTASQIQAVGNGWYRCSVTGTFTANSNRTISVASADTVFTSPSVGSEVYIWGAQLEATAFSTSHIATVASQVTRAADAASMTGTNFSSWYSQGQGTLYVENLAQNAAAANNKNLRFSDGTTSNEIWLGSGSPGTSARSQILSGNVTYFDSNMSNQVTAEQFGTYALAFETNNTVLCSNGTLGTVDTAVPIPSSINQFAIIPPSQRAGYYKKIVYFPRRLSNEELQEMTS